MLIFCAAKFFLVFGELKIIEGLIQNSGLSGHVEFCELSNGIKFATIAAKLWRVAGQPVKT